MKNILIIGSGFAGLSAACSLARMGYGVTVLEKNQSPGGRARSFQKEGFSFDMGPSWYWMPDVFEQFFQSFGKSASDYYKLRRLDPSYRVFFEDERMDIPANYEELKSLFESLEKGAGKKRDAFLEQAEYKYRVGMNDLVYKPGLSVMEYADQRIIKGALKLQLFRSISKHIRSYFSHPKIISILEFPVLFLGATPEKTPALYSLMNYADIKLGTWYPEGGMVRVVEGMVKLAKELGVEFKLNREVSRILVRDGLAKGVKTQSGEFISGDIVVSGADYHHTDSRLLEKPYRNYSPSYWESRTMAPSALIYYVGLNKKVKGLLHHNLFFDEDFKNHALDIYNRPKWPEKPLFYVCAPSKTDASVAPPDGENLFFLLPVAAGLQDTEEVRSNYFELMLKRLEQHTGENISEAIVCKTSYAQKDFVRDYNAFKGNAYGLANTLKQTAFLKPSMKNKKVDNIFYAGQLTVPGPGVPPAIISGRIAANQIAKLNPIRHEKVV